MKEKKNVLLITIDSLRADHMSCLGYHRKTTPNIDRLAKEATLFSQAIANAHNTRTSFPAIFSSTYPLMYKDSASNYFKPLSPLRVMIAEVLKEYGYSTAAFHSTPLLSQYYGYNRGFDFFKDHGATEFQEDKILKRLDMSCEDTTEVKIPKRSVKASLRRILSKNKYMYKIASNVFHFLRNMIGKVTLPYEKAEIVTQEALFWLYKHHNTNFFLWIHYMDVHSPYLPSKEYLQKFRSGNISRKEMIRLCKWADMSLDPNTISETDLRKLIDLYDATISYVDDNIKLLIDGLKEMDVYDETLIIITADHGEEFKEHGGFGHFAKLYDELIHIPLIIKVPMLKGRVVEDIVQHLDIAPTILDFLRIQKPRSYQGRSLIPLIKRYEGHEEKKEEGVISETLHNHGRIPIDGKGHRLISYRTREWKFIYNEENNHCELYNLEDDPNETENIYKEEREMAKIFERKIMEHVKMEERMHKAVEMLRIRKAIEKIRR